MGQTPNLLMLPLDLSVRPEGFEPHSRATGVPRRDVAPTDPFLSSNVYAEQIPLDEHGGGKGTFGGNGYRASKYRDARVSSVTWLGTHFKVSYTYGPANANRHKYLFARRVIVASGPGPAATTRYAENTPLGVYCTGDTYLNHNVQLRGRVVAVEGGSATAAWAVEKALLSGAAHVYWFTRPGQGTLEDRFAAAFPAGDRNVWLKYQPNVTRLVGTIAESEWVMRGSVATDRLRLLFQSGHEFFVDQYVAAVGATETGGFLAPQLTDGLTAIVDTHGHLHPSRSAILAYAGVEGRLMIVGAGVFKVSSNARRPQVDPSRYARGNEYLPTAARPPEGIPTIIASLATLTRYLHGGASRWLDVNLANFGDLDEHFAMSVARSFVRVVLPEVGTYSVEQIARFIADQVIGTRIMKTSPYGVKVEELAEIHRVLSAPGFGEGPHLKSLLDAYYR
ncbi:hypothetical protein COCOR_01484 [Corallococcus coralloides DSM 2259]|uniref:Uncharacterized protein n=2 Tax=Corallococcus coralloides TaxID=184914 RepID=H8MVD4_CORCM|nr:hypothetical protein COCOR_01484 [Corallococcus coralloides DSM 2259]